MVMAQPSTPPAFARPLAANLVFEYRCHGRARPAICGPRPESPLNSGRGGSQKTMKIHEYQAKEILAKYGVAVPKGEVANTFEEASAVARKLFAEGASGVVVKAQIHAGGRGKGGGVKVAKTREDAELHA